MEQMPQFFSVPKSPRAVAGRSMRTQDELAAMEETTIAREANATADLARMSDTGQLDQRAVYPLPVSRLQGDCGEEDSGEEEEGAREEEGAPPRRKRAHSISESQISESQFDVSNPVADALCGNVCVLGFSWLRTGAGFISVRRTHTPP